MGDHDVLAGLDEIPWEELRHCYGPAGDVPGQLRALRSPDPVERERALWHLYGNIYHQGGRYEAAAYAVPFLARLALDPGTEQRAEIVVLLGALAIGYDDDLLPHGLDIAAWRAEIERKRSAGDEGAMRETGEGVAAAAGEPEQRIGQERRDVYDMRWVDVYGATEAELAAYDAVLAEIPRLRTLLTADDPRLRAATAGLLGWFPEEAAGSVAALGELLESEAVPIVLANAIVSVGLLSGTGLIPRLREHLGGPDPLVRWAAAVALARLGRTDPEVIAALTAAMASMPLASPEDLHFHDGNTRDYAALALGAVADRVPPEAVDGVLDALARHRYLTKEMVGAALRLAFPDGPLRRVPPFAELTAPQRRLVRILADLDPDSWRGCHFDRTLQKWNLPADRAACRAYAGLPE
ncbi:HEAT repeat domain-containing protein [Thermobispora bispora]|uniref:PBS lyase HEAT domain protein repeat-containing protein n=1 Tax=Thermobispora bispora (strain ATCC 19993 / DSM 43833 / CBS 139.67 / JCM 10125 / KCTC 9307 / NBRC 14880 / R51) TaxID=469371 RepID=D6Y7V0_THEBD|nr:HEAT repeat domain-containing protein [Thermobispora bispora]ADG87769.1 PBS lyase HEAT domain protein repeat-containing protein [Thermobispora bispora DSM 43833]MDI9579333.1 HEAT repeat domain-containing protein [Thermobispora sp.]